MLDLMEYGGMSVNAKSPLNWNAHMTMHGVRGYILQ